FNVARPLSEGAFAIALTFDATASVLASMIAISYAVCAGQLFRVRGLIAELLLYTAFALAIAAATFAGVEALLAWAPGPTSLRLGLFVVSMLPLAPTAVAVRIHAPVERVLLTSIDPRRAARIAILERTQEEMFLAGRSEAVTMMEQALSEITL